MQAAEASGSDATTAARDAASQAANDAELKAAQEEERKRHEAREAEIDASWSKKIVVTGTGAAAFRRHSLGRGLSVH